MYQRNTVINSLGFGFPGFLVGAAIESVFFQQRGACPWFPASMLERSLRAGQPASTETTAGFPSNSLFSTPTSRAATCPSCCLTRVTQENVPSRWVSLTGHHSTVLRAQTTLLVHCVGVCLRIPLPQSCHESLLSPWSLGFQTWPLIQHHFQLVCPKHCS